VKPSKTPEYKKAFREARILKGVCVLCKHPALADNQYCHYHAAYQRALQRDAQQRRRDRLKLAKQNDNRNLTCTTAQ
jgi:hypothetical protein